MAHIKFKRLEKGVERYAVILDGEQVGVVFQAGLLWDFEDNPYPNAKFWKRIQAANKLVERRKNLAGLSQRIAAMNAGR